MKEIKSVGNWTVPDNMILSDVTISSDNGEDQMVTVIGKNGKTESVLVPSSGEIVFLGNVYL